MRHASTRLVFLIVALAFSVSCKQPELPRLSEVPAFTLTDQSGARFTSASLRGELFIADFIFTSCPSVCPMITAQMSNLQRRLPGVRLVSFSVDPEVDTPDVLRAYGESHGADFDRWSFVTGSRDAMEELVVSGFRVRMGAREPLDEGYDIMHASHFILVDEELRIRGYYASDAQGIAKLERDTRSLQ